MLVTQNHQNLRILLHKNSHLVIRLHEIILEKTDPLIRLLQIILKMDNLLVLLGTLLTNHVYLILCIHHCIGEYFSSIVIQLFVNLIKKGLTRVINTGNKDTECNSDKYCRYIARLRKVDHCKAVEGRLDTLDCVRKVAHITP